MRYRLILWCAFLSASQIDAQAFKQIFNMTNLDGWIVYGTERWYVDKGELICESGPDKEYGYLGTKDHYKDFDLRLEFKQEADGNSGVFFTPPLRVPK